MFKPVNILRSLIRRIEHGVKNIRAKCKDMPAFLVDHGLAEQGRKPENL